MDREKLMRVNFESFNLMVVVVVGLVTMTTRLAVVDGSYGRSYDRHGQSYDHNKHRWYTPSTSYAPSTSYTPSTSDTPSTSYTTSTNDMPSASDTPSTSYTPWTSDAPSASYTPWTDTPSTSDIPSTSDVMPSTSFSSSSTWQSAHATFYGDETASETMGGACGYGNLYDSGYGFETAALSTVMFNNGKACGACYEIKCVESKWCFANAPSIKITATNLCPPNWYQSSDAGGWCNPPRSHFDLSKPMFMRIAEWTAGIVPVNYRRVSCGRQGGIRFQFQGNPYWLLVVVLNVGGDGDVSEIWVKGTLTNWISMSRNWGASFQAFSKLGGQPLSFKLQNAAGETVYAYNVCPTYWSTGQTYEANTNFIN